MGLLGDLFGRSRIKDPVRGTARVISADANRSDATWQNCRMKLLVEGDGIPPTEVDHHAIVRESNWPTPGMVLQATIDRRNPKRLKIEWGRPDADLISGFFGEGAPGVNVEVVSVPGDTAALTEEQKETLRGIGLDIEQLVARTGMPPAIGDDAAGDRIDKLERLARLRDRGALTEAEFAEQKRRILRSED